MVRRRSILSLVLALVVVGLLAAAPGVSAKKRPPVQPKAGSIWTGGTANRGAATIEVKRIWVPDLERTFLMPYITWTRVSAVCDIFNGAAFVPTKRRITARLAVTTAPGAVRKGHFDETITYNGQPQSRFSGTFTRTDVRGTVEKLTTFGIDVAVGAGCRWGPLTFDLALQP